MVVSAVGLQISFMLSAATRFTAIHVNQIDKPTKLSGKKGKTRIRLIRQWGKERRRIRGRNLKLTSPQERRWLLL